MFNNLFLSLFLFAVYLFSRALSGCILSDDSHFLLSNCVNVISGILPFLIYGIFFKSGLKNKEHHNRPDCIFIYFSALVFANTGAYFENLALNFFKISSKASAVPEFGNGTFAAYLLFAALVIPIAEEYIFRKNLVEILCVYGKIPAVIISSLMFSSVHSNGTRAYAFIMGIALGIIFLCCGIKYSIVFHIFNNSLNIILAILQNTFGTKVDFVYNIFVLTAGVISTFVLVREHFLKGGGAGGKET